LRQPGQRNTADVGRVIGAKIREVDTIFGFETEHDALEWIRGKSQGWLIEQDRSRRVE
jgi:hypothetical protein